jgi:hypothetical protein
MDVMLANGKQIHTTPTSYPDIYYALRGAADSFGIVTTFYLQTKPAPTEVFSYATTFNSFLNSSTAAAPVILRLQDFALNSLLMDGDITLEIHMNVYGSFVIRGWYFGSNTHLTNTILPAMLSGMPKPDHTSIRNLAWLDALNDIAEGRTPYRAIDVLQPPSNVLHKVGRYVRSGTAYKTSAAELLQVYGGERIRSGSV